MDTRFVRCVLIAASKSSLSKSVSIMLDLGARWRPLLRDMSASSDEVSVRALSEIDCPFSVKEPSREEAPAPDDTKPRRVCATSVNELRVAAPAPETEPRLACPSVNELCREAAPAPETEPRRPLVTEPSSDEGKRLPRAGRDPGPSTALAIRLARAGRAPEASAGAPSLSCSDTLARRATTWRLRLSSASSLRLLAAGAAAPS